MSKFLGLGRDWKVGNLGGLEERDGGSGEKSHPNGFLWKPERVAGNVALMKMYKDLSLSAVKSNSLSLSFSYHQKPLQRIAQRFALQGYFQSKPQLNISPLPRPISRHVYLDPSCDRHPLLDQHARQGCPPR